MTTPVASGSGQSNTLWCGTQAAYNALPVSVRAAQGFIAVVQSSTATPPCKGISPGFVYQNVLAGMSSAASSSAIAAIAATGCKMLRFNCAWNGGTDGAVRSGASDTIIRQVIAAGMDVVMILEDNTSGASATNGFCGPWMTSAVTRLAGMGVHAWEVQNEMNLGANWPGGTPSVSAYVATLRAAYRVIHAADPSATVLHTGLAPYGKPTGTAGGTNINPLDFFSAMYAAGAHGFFDGANFHAYSFPTMPAVDDGGYNVFYGLPTAYAQMQARGDGAKQIWITECGVATGTDGGYDPGNVVSQAVQAQVMDQYYATSAARPWSGPVLWYSWIDSPSDGDYGLYTASGVAKTCRGHFAAVASPLFPIAGTNRIYVGGR